MELACPRCGPEGDVEADFDGAVTCHACGTIVRESGTHYSTDDGSNFDPNASRGVRVSLNQTGAAFTSTPGSLHARNLHPNDRPDRTVALKVAHKLLSSLKFDSAPLKDQVQAVLSDLYRKKSVRGEGRYIAAAAVYGVLRKNNKPITFLDITDCLHVQNDARAADFFLVGRTWLRLSREMETLGNIHDDTEPTIYMEKYITTIGITKPQDQAQAVKDSCRLIKISSQDWLSTGRKPAAINAAALLLACEAMGFPYTPQQAADTFSVSKKTISLRVNEIKQSLLKVCSALPWAKDLTVKNINQDLRFIFDNLELLSRSQAQKNLEEYKEETINDEEFHEQDQSIPVSSTNNPVSYSSQPSIPQPSLPPNPSVNTKIPRATPRDDKTYSGKRKRAGNPAPGLPPSFVQSCDQRERRRKKMIRAKARILEAISGDPDLQATLKAPSGLESVTLTDEERKELASETERNVQLDEEDFNIEKALVAGKEESAILGGYWNSDPSPFIHHNNDGDDTLLTEKDLPNAELAEHLLFPPSSKSPSPSRESSPPPSEQSTAELSDENPQPKAKKQKKSAQSQASTPKPSNGTKSAQAKQSTRKQKAATVAGPEELVEIQI